MSDIFGNEAETELPQDEPVVEAAEEVVEEVVEEVEEVAPEPTVSISAFNDARSQARQAQTEVSQLRQTVEQLQGLKTQMDEWRANQAQAQEQQQFDTDPLGTLKQQNEALQAQLTQMNNQIQGRDNAVEVRDNLRSQVSAHVESFQAQQPQYQAALSYVMEGRAKEMALWGMPEAQISQALEQEAEQIAAGAIRAGQNPAEMIWNVAHARGFKATAPKKADVSNIAKGQAKSQTLAGTQGTEDAISLTDISKMSDDDFDNFWDKMQEDANPTH